MYAYVIYYICMLSLSLYLSLSTYIYIYIHILHTCVGNHCIAKTVEQTDIMMVS